MRKSLQDSESVCSTGPSTRKRGFSLRRFLVASHLIGHRPPRTSSVKNKNYSNTSGTKDTVDAKSSTSSKDSERGVTITGSQVELHQATSRSSVLTTSTKNLNDGTTSGLGNSSNVGNNNNSNNTSSSSSSSSSTLIECPLCTIEMAPSLMAELSGCSHRACYDCLAFYLRIEISESRIAISCPECNEPMHPNEIRRIIRDSALYEKYEDFMVRRVLAVDPDTRWCPAPDCTFAVIAAGCASCPKIKCERPGCNAYFCYHCKAEWHPNQTCDAARAQRSPPNVRSGSVSFSQDSQQQQQQYGRNNNNGGLGGGLSSNGDDIKPCPRCQVLIVKMDDGSCNHMMCAVCGAEFCWLCMKEISDLHYLSPSGCTFWGKKPWSRKKKILWQLGTLVGAPVGIALVAGIAVPAMIIGIPVWVGRKLYTRYRLANKHKRNAAIIGGAIASILISPLLAGLAVGIGVPILLFYVYGVVPVSLCRSGGCGVTTTSTGVKFEFDDETDLISQTGTSKNPDNTSIDAVSHRDGNPSIGEASLSMVSGSQMLRIGNDHEHEVDRESASNVAIPSASLAGSIGSGSAVHRLEVQADVASTQRFSISMSSETASASASLSDDVTTAAITNNINNTAAAATTTTTTTAAAAAAAAVVAAAAAVAVVTNVTNEQKLQSYNNYQKQQQLAQSSPCIICTNTTTAQTSTTTTTTNTTNSDDCSSERVRFNDNVSVITSPYKYQIINRDRDDNNIISCSGGGGGGGSIGTGSISSSNNSNSNNTNGICYNDNGNNYNSGNENCRTSTITINSNNDESINIDIYSTGCNSNSNSTIETTTTTEAATAAAAAAADDYCNNNPKRNLSATEMLRNMFFRATTGIAIATTAVPITTGTTTTTVTTTATATTIQQQQQPLDNQMQQQQLPIIHEPTTVVDCSDVNIVS